MPVATAEIEDRLDERNVLIETRFNRTQQRSKIRQVFEVTPQQIVIQGSMLNVHGYAVKRASVLQSTRFDGK